MFLKRKFLNKKVKIQLTSLTNPQSMRSCESVYGLSLFMFICDSRKRVVLSSKTIFNESLKIFNV